MYQCALVSHCNFSAFLSFSTLLTYFFAYASKSFFAFCDIDLFQAQLWSLLLLFFVLSIAVAVCFAVGVALNFNELRAREWVVSAALTAATTMTLALTLKLTLAPALVMSLDCGCESDSSAAVVVGLLFR